MSKTISVPKPFSTLVSKGFDLMYVSHAEAILTHDFPEAMGELDKALANLELPISEIIGSGGGETFFTQRLRHGLNDIGWPKHVFNIKKVVDGQTRESISHEIDHVRRTDGGVVALEIEWNNKDPFFDRDLENFKRLHAEGAISVGVLITRGSSLQEYMPKAVRKFVDDRNINSYEDLLAHGYEPTTKQRKAVTTQCTRAKKPLLFRDAWVNNFVKNKYGAATTYWEKLMHRVQRGVGNPCPLVLIGLPAQMVLFDNKKIEVLEEKDEAEEVSPT